MSGRRKDRVSLPWEHRRGGWRRLIGHVRWTTVLAAVAFVAASSAFYQFTTHRVRARETKVAVLEVKRAVDRFRDDLGRCPLSTVELVHPPVAKARYLESMPNDGWGRQLWVECPGYFDASQTDVISAGPSGSFFVDDNIE